MSRDQRGLTRAAHADLVHAVGRDRHHAPIEAVGLGRVATAGLALQGGLGPLVDVADRGALEASRLGQGDMLARHS